MTSLLMSYPPISISHRSSTFSCRYWNSRDVVATSPFSRPPPTPPPLPTHTHTPTPARALRRAGSQAIIIRQDKAVFETSFNKKKKKKKKKKTTKKHTHTDTQRRAVSISNNFVVQVWTWNRLISNIARTVTSTPVSKRMLCVSQGKKKLWSSKNVYYILL